MKDFCVAAVKVKNDLERNKAIARSVPEKCPVFFGLNGIRKIAEIHRCQAEQGGECFLPKLDVAYLVQRYLPLWVGYFFSFFSRPCQMSSEVG